MPAPMANAVSRTSGISSREAGQGQQRQRLMRMMMMMESHALSLSGTSTVYMALRDETTRIVHAPILVQTEALLIGN